MHPGSCRRLGDGSVSVAMSAYNAAATIAEALESIIEGSHRPDEVVVVDDGSTDGTDERLAAAERRWPGLLCVVRQPNRGTGDALRVASERVGGEFLVHADADDVYAPRRIEWTLELFASTGADVVGGQILDTLHGRVLRRSDFPLDEAASAVTIAGGRDPVGHSVMSLRTSGLERFGDYRPLRHAEDLELMLRWARRGARFANSADVFGSYRMRPDHVSLERQTKSMLWTRYARHLSGLDGPDLPSFEDWFARESLRPAVIEAIGRVARRRVRYALATVAERIRS